MPAYRPMSSPVASPVRTLQIVYHGNMPFIETVDFVCLTRFGRLVQVYPGGYYCYAHQNLPHFYPINVWPNALLPLQYIKGNVPVLACEENLRPLNHRAPPLHAVKCFPEIQCIRTIGGPFPFTLTIPAAANVTRPPPPVKKIRNERPVNAFIAYRCLFSPFFPLGKQMDVSGYIRRMWANADESVKDVFTSVARVYTIERDDWVAHRFNKIPLKKYLFACLWSKRFQFPNPIQHVRKYLLEVEVDCAIELKDFIDSDDDMQRLFEDNLKDSAETVEMIAFLNHAIVKEREQALKNNCQENRAGGLPAAEVTGVQPIDWNEQNYSVVDAGGYHGTGMSDGLAFTTGHRESSGSISNSAPGSMLPYNAYSAGLNSNFAFSNLGV